MGPSVELKIKMAGSAWNNLCGGPFHLILTKTVIYEPMLNIIKLSYAVR